MIRTGAQYLDSIRDGRRVWINGERVADVTRHPMFRPIIDFRARLYDMQHDPKTAKTLVYEDETGEKISHLVKIPRSGTDWESKRAFNDLMLNSAGGVIDRIGEGSEMWSLHDGAAMLNEFDSQFADNIACHVMRSEREDRFQASANTDPKGDRSKRPQEQDPDMLLHVVRETDAGVIVRGAKFETAAAYANQAFVKPTIANWGDEKLSDYAIGFISRLSAPGLRFICRTGFAGRGSPEDYPLSNRFDEIDALIVFDDVLVPWEDVLFYRDTRAATFIRATLHRSASFSFVQRAQKNADMLIGAALFNVQQTGLEKQPAVQEKLATLACYREGINAHITAAIAAAEPSPGGLVMPNQSLILTGRVLAASQLPQMMHLARELCGGQICVTPDAATFLNPETAPYLDKYYRINETWAAEDRRKLLAYARDLLNSDYAGHRLTFQLFSQSPPFAHLSAVYRNFNWRQPLEFVQRSAGLSPKVLETTGA
jgi:4-hydroxyphenylacetate 3-monooxygenase